MLAPRPAAILAQVSSAPLDSVATEVNRRSVNIGAELMLQWAAGNQLTGPGLLTQHVAQVVGPAARVHLVDGSGLSEFNRMSSRTQMLYLARYPQLPGNARFPLLLPANGTGTLRRLRGGGMARGVVHAKTGTLDEVATLAGYLARPGRTAGAVADVQRPAHRRRPRRRVGSLPAARRRGRGPERRSRYSHGWNQPRQ